MSGEGEARLACRVCRPFRGGLGGVSRAPHLLPMGSLLPTTEQNFRVAVIAKVVRERTLLCLHRSRWLR